ncbi:MAG TPA: hypothetical protein VEY91_12820 [Candidatus Limnocylindria bacterium]|nr:hypothetical protein [Candidatus Limnocylindria bacterium]
MAGIPCATQSTFPANGILLVGRNDGLASPREDVAGEFQVIARDCGATLLPGVIVAVSFANCTDSRVCNPQTFPGLSVAGCPGGPAVVYATTNELGVATFRITGGAINSGNSPSADADCAELRLEGVLLGTLTVASIDQNPGSPLNGYVANDLSVAVSDVLDSPAEMDGRSDVNFNGQDQANDLSLMLSLLLRPGNPSANNCGAASACP